MLGLFQYIDSKLERWARRKYKTLSGRKQRGVEWLGKMKTITPRMFVHWRSVGIAVG